MSPFKTINEKCCVCFKLIKKVSGTPKCITTAEDLDAFSFVSCNISIGDILCGNCRTLNYKKKQNWFCGVTKSGDNSDDINNEMIEKNSSSLSEVRFSQSSVDDPSFKLINTAAFVIV